METIPEEDYLQISGLQHYRFCPRQWALIHLEQQWAENLRTTEGVLLHERAHQEGLRESRGDLLTVRGLRVFSPTLGLSGACDVVEFRRAAACRCRDGRAVAGLSVEYKRGSPKADSCDALQLCAQAMCLEEMLCCDIPEGALFYGEPRRREPVVFTEELRQEVRQCAAEMRDLYRRGRTPMPKRAKRCNACSLKEVCLPGLPKLAKTADYLRKSQEDGPCGNY